MRHSVPIVRLVCLVALIATAPAAAQTNSRAPAAAGVQKPTFGRPTVHVGLGYARPEVGELGRLFQQSVSAYRDLDIPVPVQEPLNGGPAISISVSVPVQRTVRIGAAASHTVQRAYALYDDAVGQLDVRSSVKLSTLGATGQLTGGLGKIRNYIGASVDAAYANFSFSDRITATPESAAINETGFIDRDNSRDLSGFGLVGSVVVGAEFLFGRYGAYVEGGVRLGTISNLSGSTTTTQPDVLANELSVGGPIVSAGLVWDL